MKILKSLVIVLAMVAMVAGATSSIFSDQDSVVGNTFSTGTLNMVVNEGVNKPMTVSSMKPGDSISGWFDAFNQGSLEAEYWFYISNVVGDDALRDALVIELKDGGYTGACDGPSIYSGSLSALIGSSNQEMTSDNNVHAGSTNGGDNIRAGWTQRICQTVTLPESTGNEAQGKTVTFDEVMYATQDMD